MAPAILQRRALARCDEIQPFLPIEVTYQKISGAASEVPFHITWVTHGSRVTEHMRELKIPSGKILFLNKPMRNHIFQYLCEKIQQKNYKVLALNVLKDHVHCLIFCREEDVSSMVRNLKGYSSFQLNRRFRFSVAGKGRQQKIWAKGHSCTLIEREEHLLQAVEYIEQNHLKHGVPPLEQKFIPTVSLEDIMS